MKENANNNGRAACCLTAMSGSSDASMKIRFTVAAKNNRKNAVGTAGMRFIPLVKRLPPCESPQHQVSACTP